MTSSRCRNSISRWWPGLLALPGLVAACDGATGGSDDSSRSWAPDQVGMASQPHRSVSSEKGDEGVTGIVSNGTVQLGVNPQAQLNVAGGTLSSGTYGTTVVGLRYVPTNGEATASGCLCEGWGAADAGTGVTGYADTDSGGIYNMTEESFMATATDATSVVRVGDVLRVTHAYRPAPTTPNLYEITVTLENISGATLSDVRYTRTMDFDVGPNTFSEYVSIRGTASTADLLYSDTNGFQVPDPLGERFSYGMSDVDFDDEGPYDQGTIFDFSFGALAAGDAVTFTGYYGAAASEAEAQAALEAVGAELYSLAQGDWDGTGDPLSASGAPPGDYGAATGEPHTFVFAFAGVGGLPLFLPESSTCGDGHLDDGEECDDGDTDSGDGCSSSCGLENTPPVCSSATANPRILWPPNHKMVAIGIEGVTDPDPGDTPAVIVTSIFQDEPVNEEGDGDTETDGTGTWTATASVRSERAGTKKTPGDGRVYHISFTASDSFGASCAGQVTICVPHDQGNSSTCIDEGPLYDSTVP